MYRQYFNLNSKPFDLLPNPEFMYFSRTHKRAITYLDYGITERAGFILLTGEVGSGKTTIIRDLIKRHGDRMLLAKVFNTNVNSEQLITMINDDFELPVQGKDKITLLRDLNQFLVEQYAKGSRPVLIIDEAQNLSADSLEEVRMLSNLETADSKLLQIILVGQPELRALLSRPELRQLRQRISIQCHLLPLTRQEMEEYIFHRLEIAGNRNAIQLSPQAFDAVYRYSGGIPRLINILGEFLLLSAFAEDVRHVEEDMICDIAGDLDLDRPDDGTSSAYSSETASVAVGGPAPFQPQQDKLLAGQMAELRQKMEFFEEEVILSNKTVIKELDERLTGFKNIIAARLGKIDKEVAALAGKMESTGPAGPAPQEPAAATRSKKSLIRWIFG